MQKNVSKALAAELAGTALVLFALVASSNAAERLAPGLPGLALVMTAVAAVLALYFATRTLGSASGAHFNPLLSMAAAFGGGWPPHGRLALAALFILAQGAGAVAGAALANFLFGMELVQISTNDSAGIVQWMAEGAAAAGLVMLALLSPGRRGILVPAYSGVVYCITSSHSLANPAVVLGRMCSSGFAGIAPESGAVIIAALLAGGAGGALLAWCADRYSLQA